LTPFKITCVTCQARLAVRSASLIGQILACPKCGSMVQVTAPATGAAAAGSAAHDSAHDSIGAAASGIAIAGAAPPSPAPAAPPTSGFEDVADFGAELDARPPSVPPSSIAKRAATPNAKPVQPAVASAVKHSVGGLSTTKLIAIGVGSAVAASALVAGVLTLLRPGTSEAPAVPSAGAAAVTPAPSVVTTQPKVAPAPPANDAVRPDTATATPPTNGDAADPIVAAPPAAVEAATPPEAPQVAPVNETIAATATAPPVADVIVADAAAANDADAPRLRIDPLDLDPEGLDLATLLNGDSGPPIDSVAMSELEQTPPPVNSDAPANEEAAAGAAALPEGGRIAEGAEIEPPAAPAILLARRLPGVKVTQMPLALFVDFATGLSAVPVSVSVDELQLAAASSSSEVSVDVKDATLEQMLAEGLRPLRLEPMVVDGQIVLRRTGAGGRRQLAYPVDDLVAGDAKPLAAWVTRFVTPEAWQAGGGDGQLEAEGSTFRIDADERVGFATILFLEQYRVACGLPPKSKYPAALLKSRAAKGELASRLEAPATFTFTRPTALRELVHWWQQEADMAILVDWPALAQSRLAPHSRVTASVAGKPWSEALTTVLEPLGLGWRLVDKWTIEISTLAELQSQPVLELYSLANATGGRSAAALMKVKALSGDAVFDDERDVLIVRGPATMQRDLLAWLQADKLLAAEPR
jgi:hypothetical protein